MIFVDFSNRCRLIYDVYMFICVSVNFVDFVRFFANFCAGFRLILIRFGVFSWIIF